MALAAAATICRTSLGLMRSYCHQLPKACSPLVQKRFYETRTVKSYTQDKVPAHTIGVTKGFNSQHTGSLEGSHWAHERMIDDIVIRKIVEGTFYELLASEVIVKRRLNKVFISMFVKAFGVHAQHKLYFLIAFNEKLLTSLLGCPVKFEVRSIERTLNKRHR